MNLSTRARRIYDQIDAGERKLGGLKKIAKEIKKEHNLALELWSTGEFFPRMLAVLVMDKKLIDQAFIDQLDVDIQGHSHDEQNQIADWLLANQLTKDKKLIAMMESWEDSPSTMQRRLFWYYQARLRWTGQSPPGNSEILLSQIEEKLAKEEPGVQWAMNFTAGQIGIFEDRLRDRCINLGKKIGLYKDEVVAKGCTPNYLPEFIRIQVEKLNR